MKTRNHITRKTALAAAVMLVLGGVATMSSFTSSETGSFSLMSYAYADEDGGGHEGVGGHKGAMGSGRGGQGIRGEGGPGYRGGKSIGNVLSDDGEEEDSDRPDWAQSPGREGKPGGGNTGGDSQKGEDYGDLFVILRYDDGTPVTVGNEVYLVTVDGTVILTEGGEVPEGVSTEDLIPVEFGRLNVARSPVGVLEHSLTEALSKLDGLTITADNIADYTDASGRFVIDGVSIDSPLENLALYEALLTAKDTDGDGLLEVTTTSSRSDSGTEPSLLLVSPDVRLDLAASMVAASSDKAGELTIDEVVLISSFLGVDDELASLVTDYTYSRDATYDDVTVWVLVEQPDGSFVPTDVNVLEALTADDGDIYGFNTVTRLELDADGNVVVDDNTVGIDVFTQAADDAVQVIEFVHTFEVPE